MSSSLSAGTLTVDNPHVSIPTGDGKARQAALWAGRLRDWLGTEPAIVECLSGRLLFAPAEEPAGDWELWAPLCRQVVERGGPEFIHDDDPVLVLAIPLPGPADASLAAVGTFLSRSVESEDCLARVATALGTNLDEAARWADRQTPIAPESLQRLADLVVSKLESDERVGELEEEIEDLSLHLAATYEEISLVYRLTQNLKISRNVDDLAHLALEWLVEIMPVEAVAIQFVAQPDAQAGVSDPRALPRLIAQGQCPIDDSTFTRLVEQLDLRAASKPRVANRSTTQSAAWAFPEIRELIVVPVGDGDQVFGWLAAFNHNAAGEFGTVEANLLSSVSAILGIHSGNTELYRQQAELLAGIIRALTSAIDAKDPYTCGHSDRVARVSVRLAEEMGCDPQTVETIYLSGLLHDVGKIGIDDDVLRKPGKLTPAEFEHIKKHAEIGYNILVDLKQLGQALPVVLHHHEAWNGTGYPHALAGENIPYLARIVAVADAFDAMGSDRPYRKGMPDEKLDGIIREGAGGQWDPTVVEAFFRARDDIRAIARRESGEQPETPF